MNDALHARTAADARIAQLEREVDRLRGQLADTESAFARMQSAYTHALEQLALLRRKLFAAKAERSNVAAEQLAFDTMFAEVTRLGAALDAAEAGADSDSDSDSGSSDEKKKKKASTKRKGHGRRDLAIGDLPTERIEITDPALEGIAERIGTEETSRLGYQRGGPRHLRLVRIVYKVPPSKTPSAPDAAPTIVTAPLPREIFKRCMLAPEMIAHILTAKYMMGVPFYRLAQQLALEGVVLDRGTMSRYAEDAGATLGAIVLAARDEAFATAFCLSTDATGVRIQPGRLDDRGPRACRQGHFFVLLADRDHVFFEYHPKQTSAAVCAMFKGFTGYLQADAHTVYNALFEGRTPRGEPPDPNASPPPIEVGCWSHARRNFWEAAVCKHPLGVEGLRWIDAIFAAERRLGDIPPSQRKVKREAHVRPVVDAFFAWARAERARPRERGLVTTALGYVMNQETALTRFLENGRLRLDNNASERALRSVAAARRSWLFFGSDDHAEAAANLFSLIASCKLLGVDPQAYLADVLRVMPYWPRERYLELAPKYWTRTRARLDATEMSRPLGHVTVPEPLAAEEQRAAG